MFVIECLILMSYMISIFDFKNTVVVATKTSVDQKLGALHVGRCFILFIVLARDDSPTWEARILEMVIVFIQNKNKTNNLGGNLFQVALIKYLINLRCFPGGLPSEQSPKLLIKGGEIILCCQFMGCPRIDHDFNRFFSYCSARYSTCKIASLLDCKRDLD